MILDSLSNLHRYTCISKNLEKAAKFLEATDLSALPLGRTDIDGEEVYCMKQHNMLQKGEPVYEAHARYADVQVILNGCETIWYAEKGTCTPMDAEKDFCLSHDAKGSPLTLTNGQFAIFFAGELHAPGRHGGKGDECEKLVLKVRI